MCTPICPDGTFFIGFLDNYGLYCGQRDYLFLLAEGNETPYTTFTGKKLPIDRLPIQQENNKGNVKSSSLLLTHTEVVRDRSFLFITTVYVPHTTHTHSHAGIAFTYFVIQVDAWAALHSSFLFWGVRFPFSYRHYKVSGKMRYAHIISVILVVLLPLPGPLVLLIDGYLITDNPNLVSAGRNTDHNFYLFTLLSTTLLAITSIMLVLLFWTIFKVCTSDPTHYQEVR